MGFGRHDPPIFVYSEQMGHPALASSSALEMFQIWTNGATRGGDIMHGMRLRTLLPLFLAVTALSQQPAPATLYVYQPHSWRMRRYHPPVYVDGVKLAAVYAGKSVALPLAPGKHLVTSNRKSSGTEIDAQSGAIYYLRVEPDEQGLFVHPAVTLVTSEQGRYEIAQTQSQARAMGK